MPKTKKDVELRFAVPSFDPVRADYAAPAANLLLSTATTIAAGQGTSPDLSIDRAKALIFACMEAAPQFEQQLREWLK